MMTLLRINHYTKIGSVFSLCFPKYGINTKMSMKLNTATPHKDLMRLSVYAD